MYAARGYPGNFLKRKFSNAVTSRYRNHLTSGTREYLLFIYRKLTFWLLSRSPLTGDPAEDIAFVHFMKQEDAEKAMELLKDGWELHNGCPVVG